MLEVDDMRCAGCSSAVKRTLLEQPGVSSAAVNLVTGTAAVQLGPETTTEGGEALYEPLTAVLTAKGFPSRRREAGEEARLARQEAAERRRQEEEQRSLWDLAVAWGLVAVCCAHHAGHALHSAGMHSLAHGPAMQLLGEPRVNLAVAMAALLGPGRPVLTDGARALRANAPNMNTLVGLGVGGAFSLSLAALALPELGWEASFFDEPVMLLAFVLLGRALEGRARARASRDLGALSRLLPEKARLLFALDKKADTVAEEMLVPVGAVREGDLVRVLPGERVPVDAEVVEGESAVDASMLTGEYRFVPKGPGSTVTAGMVNWEGELTLRTTVTGDRSALAGIARLVEEAQSREAPVQRIADAITGPFVYTVIAAAGTTFAFWYTWGAALFPDVLETVGNTGDESSLLLSLKLAIDVLVVACPCALGLATPTAVLVATSLAARRGVLLRGGDVLERLAGVDCVVLDKTGTITEGRPRVSSIRPRAGVKAEELVALAAAVEASSIHPLAEAVVAHAEALGLEPPSADAARAESGQGAEARVDGARVAVGRLGYVARVIGGAASAADSAERGAEEVGSGPDAAHGVSVVVVGMEGRGLLGEILLTDRVRADAAGAVSALRALGGRVYVCSGDAQAAAEAAAAAAGIDAADVRGGCLPVDKVAFVEKLKAEGKTVAMVGDGVNDAPALATADVGLAMSRGMDAAGEAANVVLLGDRLGQAPEALALSQAGLRTIRQNLAWALVYNCVGIPLAAGAALPALGVALSPSSAGAMMALSSVSVVSNSLLLSRFDPPRIRLARNGAGEQPAQEEHARSANLAPARMR